MTLPNRKKYRVRQAPRRAEENRAARRVSLTQHELDPALKGELVETFAPATLVIRYPSSGRTATVARQRKPMSELVRSLPPQDAVAVAGALALLRMTEASAAEVMKETEASRSRFDGSVQRMMQQVQQDMTRGEKLRQKRAQATAAAAVAAALSESSPHSPTSRSTKFDELIAEMQKDFVARQRHNRLPSKSIATLLRWFMTHLTNPYPTDDEKKQLSHDTGLTKQQLRNWFTNTRKRHLAKVKAGVEPQTFLDYAIMSEYKRQMAEAGVDVTGPSPESRKRVIAAARSAGGAAGSGAGMRSTPARRPTREFHADSIAISRPRRAVKPRRAVVDTSSEAEGGDNEDDSDASFDVTGDGADEDAFRPDTRKRRARG